MVKSSPTPKDTQEFQFKLHSRFKAFEYKNDIPVPCFCNLVATASRYGLIFFGSNDAYFQVIELKTIENSSLKDGEFRNYERRTISLPSCPYFLSVNCDCRKIAVVVNKGECPVAIVYDVMSFLKEEVIVINQIRLSASPNVTVIDVCWNPAISEIFSACKSDGTLGIYELKDSKVDIVELPAQACARSICWSPKGKQIAVGDSKGKITQYKPDLKVARIIQAPELNPGPAAVISLRWISNFQFIAWYNCYESNSSAVLMVVDAPKTGPISYTSFEDMDFRTGPEQSLRFYMVQLPQWNVLMLSNSNYTEVDVVAYEKDHWIQWLLDDAGRAELPLSSNHEDTYPIGMAVDTGSTLPVSFGESVLPPEPYLFLMSHHGLVVCFKVLNLINGAPTLCTPPDNLTDRSGIKFFKTTSNNANVIPAPTQQAPLGVLEENKNKPKENVTVVAPLPQTQPSLSFPANLNVAPSMGSSLFFPTTCSSLFTSPSQQQAKPKIVATRITTPIKKTEAQNTFLPPTTTNQQYSFSMPATTVVASNNMFAFEGSLISQNPPSSSELFRHLIGSTVNQGQSREDVDVSQGKSPVTMTVGKTSVEPEGEISSQEEEEKKKGQSDLVVENVYESQEETEALVGKMVKEECELLQAELSVLRARANQINVKLGTDDEIARMIQQTDNLQEFVQEVTENSASQAIDVYQLKQSVIQGWIWYEEAQSRFAISRDPSMALIQRTQPLDPASKRQLDDIRQTLHYLDTQLVQASGALDERWELFQDSCRKTLRLKIPTLENVFQTMVKQNGVLLKQRYILKDISNRIQTFRSKSKSAGSSLVLSLDNVDALKQQLETLQLEPQSLQEMQYLRVMRKNERFTVSKIERLKSHLKGQKVKYVPAHKPQFSGSLAKTTNELERSENEKQRKGGDGCKTLYPDKVTTLLGADVSPIRPSEKTIILNKNYTPPVQSTPKIDFNSKIKTTPTTITSFIFSPVTKTITYLQSQPLQKTTTFMFSPENNTTTKANQTVTVPTTNKVFVETSSTSQSFLKSSSSPTSVTTASSVPPIAQSSKIITFGTPPTITTTTTSTIANSNSPKTTTAHDVFSDIFSIKKTTTAADTMKTSPWSSSFTFGSAFAPTTDNANVFAAKGGSLFAPAASVPTLVRNNSKNLEQLSQQPPSSSSAVVVNFKETPSANEAKSTSSTGFNFIPSSSPGNRSETAATTIVATSFSKQPFSFASAINVTPNSCDSNTTSLVGEQSKAVETVITSMPWSTPSSSSSVVQSTTTTSASFVKPSSAPLFENGNEKTAATSSSSIFDGTKTSAVPAIPTAAAVTPSDFGSALEASQTPSFAAATLGGTPDKTETSQTIGTSLSIFGNSKVTTQANSAFQQVPAAAVVTTSTLSVPIMSTVAATQQSVLESQTFSGQSIFGLPSTTTTTRNVFGAPAVSSQNIFGAPGATTSQNIFANPTASTQSIFGPSSSSSQQSVFGAPTTTTAGQNVYGTSPIATTSSQSIFGGASSTSVQSIFGTASTTTTSAQSTLDAPTTNTTTTTTTAVQSVFGAPSGQSVFGTTSIFGASSNTQQSSIFGSETAPVSTQSIFGTSSTFGSGSAPSSQSIFGSSVPIAATQSPFSFVSNVPSTTSTFGFDKKPVFGSSFGSTDTGTTSNANSFNFGSFNLDGGASGSGGLGSSPSSTFGQNQNPFAAKPSTEQKASVFGGGSSGGNLFGTPATTTAATFSSIFGGGTTSTFGGGGGGGSAGFDQSPSSSTFGSSSTPFGTPSTFGQSAFGTTNTFGTNQQQTGGVFTSSANPVSQTGFGFSQQTAKSAFGSAPVFGSSPAFGGAATFGSQPVFGGNSSNFGGGDSKVFGSTTPAPAFGSATQQQNSTFANMANQNIGFGTLVQQNPTTSAPTFSGGSSFSSWR